jgi:hypothetical protein
MKTYENFVSKHVQSQLAVTTPPFGLLFGPPVGPVESNAVFILHSGVVISDGDHGNA